MFLTLVDVNQNNNRFLFVNKGRILNLIPRSMQGVHEASALH